MTALLQQFLITPSNAFKSTTAGLTQDIAAERLAQTLKHFSVGEDAAMSIVYALLNTLYDHNNTKEQLHAAEEKSVIVQENVIAAISKIASIYKSEKVDQPNSYLFHYYLCSCEYIADNSVLWCFEY
jgi:phosphatidylinositol 4-kinase